MKRTDYKIVIKEDGDIVFFDKNGIVFDIVPEELTKHTLKLYIDNPKEESYLQKWTAKNGDKVFTINHGKFIKTSSDCEKEISLEWFTALEFSLYLYIKNTLSYSSGKAKFTQRKSLDYKKLKEIFPYTDKSLKKSLKKLEEHEIIKVTEKNIFFNPFIAYRGNTLTEELYDMFKNSKWNRSNEHGL